MGAKQTMAPQKNLKAFLSGTNIQDKYFIGNASIRSMSIDLQVDCIIKNGKVIRKKKISIKPQEMFIVVLKGNVRLPANCYGVSYPKTTLCQQGVHILNSGLIDPEYDGYLSTVAINFSSTSIELRQEDVCMRLMIFENTENYNGTSSFKIDYDEYINKRIEESKEYPDTFLDVPRQVKDLSSKMANSISSSITNKMVYILTIATVLFAVFSFWIGSAKISSLQDAFFTKSQETFQTGTVNAENELLDLVKKYDELSEQLNILQEQLNAHATTGGNSNE